VPPAFRTDHAPLLGELAGQAADLGVHRLVLLSARGVDQGPDNPLRAAEQAVRAAAGDRAAVTVLRPSWFMQNFTEAFFAPGVAEGQLVAPTGAGAEPFIDAEDIAAVAVAALTEDGHGGRTTTCPAGSAHHGRGGRGAVQPARPPGRARRPAARAVDGRRGPERPAGRLRRHARGAVQPDRLRRRRAAVLGRAGRARPAAGSFQEWADRELAATAGRRTA
jgi:hypothetical protein